MQESPENSISRCAACGGGDLSPTLRGIPAFTRANGPASYSIISCADCGLGHTFPLLPPADIAAHYEKFGPHQASGASKRTLTRISTASQNSLRSLLIRGAYRLSGAKFASFLGKKGSILDIGCGSGDFSLRLHAAGWSSYAHDFYEGAGSVARAHNIKVYIGPAIHLPQLVDIKFDVVTSWHVLEHAHHPREILSAAHGCLKPGGHLVVEVPNFASLESRWFGKNWFALQPPIHLMHFTKRSLSQMLTDAGFEIESVTAKGSCWRHSSRRSGITTRVFHFVASTLQGFFNCGAALRITARKL